MTQCTLHFISSDRAGALPPNWTERVQLLCAIVPAIDKTMMIKVRTMHYLDFTQPNIITPHVLQNLISNLPRFSNSPPKAIIQALVHLLHLNIYTCPDKTSGSISSCTSITCYYQDRSAAGFDQICFVWNFDPQQVKFPYKGNHLTRERRRYESYPFGLLSAK